MDIKFPEFKTNAKSDKFADVFKLASAKLAECFSESTPADAFPSLNEIIFSEMKPGEAGKRGFAASFRDGRLEILSAHHNLFMKAFDELLEKLKSGETVFDFLPECDTSHVYYEDFGAVGDGLTNDFFAMKRAHLFANEGGQTVCAKTGKAYRITEADEPISVKTSTDFCGAKLIFDDTRVSRRENDTSAVKNVIFDTILFRIDSDYPYFHADERMLQSVNSAKDEDGYVLRGLEIGKPSESINLKLGYPALLLIKNSNYKNYKRYGFFGDEGAYQREILLIDSEGNIDKSTPMLHGYRDITDIIIHRTDVKPITVKNAMIETLQSRVYDYKHYSLTRQFSVERSHVTFENIHHSVLGEMPRFEPVRLDKDGLCRSAKSEGFVYRDGAIYDKDGKLYTAEDVKPYIGHGYYGFLHVDLAHDTLVKGCTFQARVLYQEGTYDITANNANKLVFADCTQNNFFEKDENGNDTSVPNMYKCWGVSGTNYCKNFDFVRCRLTRYDAHAGVTNGKVIDSEITLLRLIGGGDFLLEGTKLYARYNAPIQLREDYGASFNGTLTVRNCEIIDTWGTGETVKSIISAPNSYWDMGYKTFFPSLIVDNLKIDKTVYLEIALIHSPSKAPEDYHAPCTNIIKDRRNDPETPGVFHYNGADTEEWIEKNIKSPGGKFSGLKYKIYKNQRGGMTVAVEDTKNRFPYTPPKFIKVLNNEDNGYQLTLYNSSFFENTQIVSSGNNLKRVDAPEE